MATRRCSRSGCGASAIATLTYVYADSTAVLGPLALAHEPHCYDLCSAHAGRLTAPRGWEVVRLQPEAYEHRQSHDDLLALADAVREAARPAPEPVHVREPVAAGAGAVGPGGGRRGHLRVLRD